MVVCSVVHYFSQNSLKIGGHHYQIDTRLNTNHATDKIRQKYRQISNKKQIVCTPIDGRLTGDIYSTFSSAILNFRNLNVYVVGEVGHPNAKIVRVVHISDTRGVHDAFVDIPHGDILIHSGDFLPEPLFQQTKKIHRIRSQILRLVKRQQAPNATNWRQHVEEIDRFFSQQPHKIKIFVPGCWESWDRDSNDDIPSAEKIQSILRSAIYLEDTCCRVCGLTVYGSPWTSIDELRPEDGASRIKWSKIFPFSKLKWTSSSRTTDPSSDESSNHIHTSISSSQSECTDGGFVLPNINAVAERWSGIPDHTDIVVSHMPAWRPELFHHVTDRIK